MEAELKEKVEQCLNCKVKPCTKGCPLENNIPAFIEKVKQDKLEEAYEILSETTVLPAICGRICPHYKQCMGKCVRGIKGQPVNIGDIEKYIGDMSIKNNYKLPNCEQERNEKIAIIGSGPAGLTCAAFLRRNGFKVTIYEKYSQLGGILRNGIPNFRLDKSILDNTIQKILDLGIETKCGMELGKNLDLNELQKEYNAIFLAIGANITKKMEIKGEELTGVYGGNELLELNNHPTYVGKKIAVVGGGNVAIDCARTINKLGAKSVTIIYRREEEQMPAEKKEIEDAKKEGVSFLFKHNITQIIGNEKVEKIECIKTELVQKEGETRKSPVEIEGSNYTIDIDYVVMALGSKTEINVVKNLGLELTQEKYVKINDKKQTSNEKVFAGGDLVGEKSTVAWAARSGREAAESIGQFLCKQLVTKIPKRP